VVECYVDGQENSDVYLDAQQDIFDVYYSISQEVQAAEWSRKMKPDDARNVEIKVGVSHRVSYAIGEPGDGNYPFREHGDFATGRIVFVSSVRTSASPSGSASPTVSSTGSHISMATPTSVFSTATSSQAVSATHKPSLRCRGGRCVCE